MGLWTVCSLLIFIPISIWMASTSASPHRCPSTYYVTETRHDNRWRYCGWYSWRSCSYVYSYNVVSKRYNTQSCCAGWSGDNCDIAACSTACMNGGTCIRPGICSCTSKFMGSSCQTPICRPPCTNGGTCTQSNICHCPPPYTGTSCESAGCSPACQNGGQCAALKGTGICHCTSNFQGPSCETTRSNACSPPCQNGGTCRGSGPFTCNCLVTFSGAQCQTPVCNGPCQNGGTCVSPDVCLCRDNYEGLRCELAICNPSCLNGGRCTLPNTCSCPKGRDGDSCEDSICLKGCKNEGYCEKPGKCHCPIEYVGPTCDAVKCIPPCKNGGSCTGPYNCTCTNGYGGFDCGTPVCYPLCENGGTCGLGNRCVCGPYFKGDRCETADRSTLGAAVSGLVIGVVTLVGLVVVILLMFRRRRQHKPMVPEPISHVANNLARRVTQRFKSVDNDYESGGDLTSGYPRKHRNVYSVNLADDDGLYMDDSELSKSAPWKYTRDKVTLGKTIAVGQFAFIKRATLEVRNGMQNVAAKLLKDGASSEDEDLMKTKISFLAKALTPHVNILAFVGAIAEEPVILLELCDGKLADWLKTLDSVSEEAHDNMIHFTMDIASGMEHLKKDKIVHGRLGVRNVLVKEGNNRPLCKITGFGPRKADTDAETGKSRIPLKSMALEQIGLGPGVQRVYNEKTDVWTFGITVWEIFSKGGKLYSQFESNELKNALESGHRLERPADCPKELHDIMRRCWLKKPKERPSFKNIGLSLKESFTEGITEGYYADLSALAENEVDEMYDDVF